MKGWPLQTNNRDKGESVKQNQTKPDTDPNKDEKAMTGLREHKYIKKGCNNTINKWKLVVDYRLAKFNPETL